MAKRNGTADSISAWVSDVKEIASNLNRLQTEVSAHADLAAMNTRQASDDLLEIENAVKSIRTRLATLKRQASGKPRVKWRPSQKAASEEEAKQFADRL
ncbi:hypothetical protein [Burkholderia ubonensis]|uniref:hypothetical protein n=1 Tax=Burkholderia ubonensis TaxID=101571 RepID=UPI000B311596|nr:hypothetical protein [Burkholderia ubonensis]